MSAHHDNVAAGLCGRCKTARSVGDGGTKTLCKVCGDAKRRFGFARARTRRGIPLDAPRVRQGRPRTSYAGPQPPS